MSRSGYSDDLDNWAMIKWRGMVASAIRGKRGQAFLKDMLAALDAMPEKQLIANDLVTPEDDVCALGALGKARSLDMQHLDPSEPEEVAAVFGIAPCLAQEVVYVNDEYLGRNATPAQRWETVRKWVAAQIKTEVALS